MSDQPKMPSSQIIEDLEADGSWGFRKGSCEKLALWIRWSVAELEFRARRIEELEDELYGE